MHGSEFVWLLIFAACNVMIQRIQSVYLLAAAFVSLASLFFPVASTDTKTLIVQNDVITCGVLIAVAILSAASIFLYKDRKLQLRLCFICIALVFIALAASYFTTTKIEETHTIHYLIAFPALSIVFLYLAMRAIRKDEALVRSMDRFR
jgi:peptidoglycan/LPS O-acetylase OafA/YrhL